MIKALLGRFVLPYLWPLAGIAGGVVLITMGGLYVAMQRADRQRDHAERLLEQTRGRLVAEQQTNRRLEAINAGLQATTAAFAETAARLQATGAAIDASARGLDSRVAVWMRQRAAAAAGRPAVPADAGPTTVADGAGRGDGLRVPARSVDVDAVAAICATASRDADIRSRQLNAARADWIRAKEEHDKAVAATKGTE